MKKITGKSNIYHENFPKSLHIDKTSIVDKSITAGKFHKFFNVGSNLAAKIPPFDKHLELYLSNVCTIFAAKSLTE